MNKIQVNIFTVVIEIGLHYIIDNYLQCLFIIINIKIIKKIEDLTIR